MASMGMSGCNWVRVARIAWSASAATAAETAIPSTAPPRTRIANMEHSCNDDPSLPQQARTADHRRWTATRHGWTAGDVQKQAPDALCRDGLALPARLKRSLALPNRSPAIRGRSFALCDAAESPPRVVLGVQLLQAGAGDMGVDLRGRQVTVPQQHLHHAQVRTVIEQMGGKGMAQRVWRQRPGNAGHPGLLLDTMPEGLAGHLRATQAGKQHVAGLAVEQEGPRLAQVAPDPGDGLLAQRHQALLAALAEHPQDALTQIDLFQGQRHQLRYPQA